ncbi:MAG TPA: hypothetical protein VMW42_13990 [Desulfatiglandales bacterium]|nr:hypothetical protein [Desulfatiglandales bacterium]
MNKQINTGEIVIYQTEDGQASLEVNLAEDTVWLSLNQMGALFDRNKSVISRHIGNIFREGKLDKSSAVAKYATAQNNENNCQSYK